MPGQIRSAEDFRRAFNVSRETLEKLELYERKLREWQPTINLVAPATLEILWQRHFADSAQLADLMPERIGALADFGSGAGFPGMVLAILLMDARRVDRVTLIESDQRKAAFLREVARVVDKPVRVLSTRIETNVTVNATGAVDFVTARALAPLGRLFELVRPYCHESTVCVFPKGQGVDAEIEAARASWQFEVDLVDSRTGSDGRIAVVRDLRPNAS